MNNLLFVLTGSLCNYFSCINLLTRKFSKLKRLIIFSYIFCIFFVFNKLLGQISTFFAFIGIMLFTYSFSTNRLVDLCCYLFGYLYTVTFNYLFLWTACIVLRMDIDSLLSHDLLTTVFSSIYCLYCGITTKVIGKLLHRKLRLIDFFTNQHLLKAIFIDLAFLVFFFIFNFSYGERLGYSYGVIAINGIIFIFLFAITVSLMYFIYQMTIREQKDKHRMEQFENLQRYADKLEQSYGIMRKFKHDYVNILTTMSGFMNSNDMNGLIEYYSEKVLPLSHDFTESDTKLGSLSYIKDTALKSLLSSKFIYAQETGLNVEIELTEPVDRLFIDSMDLSRILGIFLDNAIEAAVETKEKQIHFCMFYDAQKLWIIIRNSSLPLVPPLGQLINQEVSSKGENRGLGLYNADMILKKYENITWSITFQDSYFTQELILADNLS